MSNKPKQDPSINQQDAALQLASVRDILFGEQFNALQQALQQLGARIDDLERNFKTAQQQTQQQLGDEMTQLQAEIGDVEAHFSEYRKLDNAAFTAELASLRGDLGASIEATRNDLLAHKVDKTALSTMFGEFAKRLDKEQS